MSEQWAAIEAGGARAAVILEGVLCSPVFGSHDACRRFWHGKTADRTAWAVGRVDIVSHSAASNGAGAIAPVSAPGGEGAAS